MTADILTFTKPKPPGSYEMARRTQRIKKIAAGLGKKVEKPRADLVALRLRLKKKELDNEEKV